jgi:hypothetical protein
LVVPEKGGRCDLLANPEVSTPSTETSPFLDEVTDTTLPGKAPKLQLRKTVPETDTGRQGENPKALERTRVKELGKIAP